VFKFKNIIERSGAFSRSVRSVSQGRNAICYKEIIAEEAAIQ